MTKKAQKMVEEYRNLMNVHFTYYKNHPNSDFEFTYKYIKEIYKDFTDMIGGMYRFKMLSEKDYDEMYDEATNEYNRIETQLWIVRQTA